MRIDATDFCVRVSHAHASLNLKLDDELGSFHGLSLQDFIVLRLLSRAEGGRMLVADLVRPMGVRQSAVLRQLLELEKTGKVQREAAPGASAGRPWVALRPAGRGLLNDAHATADAVCARVVGALEPESLPAVHAAMDALCRSNALAL
jgi:DNA-binding MarR family transcriptional regulator